MKTKTPTPYSTPLLLLLTLSAAAGAICPAQGLDAQQADSMPTRSDSTRLLEIEDQYALKRLGSAEISPDGAWVAYTVSTTDLKKEESKTQIWMVSTTGGDPIPLTMSGESAGSPKWSPDGKYLSFTASRGENARSQVWLLDRRGGEARQLTEVKQGVGSYEWSPDGTKLALTLRDADTTRTDSGGDRGGPTRSRARDPWVIDRLQIKRDGRGYLTDTTRTHLYVFDVESKDLSQITSGRWDEGSPTWSPDGSKIAFVSNRTEDPDANSNSDIWVVSADNTDRGGTLIRITDYEGGDGSPAWSPDGEWIAYTTGINDPRFSAFETRHLALKASDGSGERRILTKALDRNVASPRFNRDGTGILVSVSDEGEGHIARVEVATGEVTRPIAGEISARGYSTSEDGTLATVSSSYHEPGDVFVKDGDELRRLTRANDSLMSALALAEVRNIHFPSADGTEIEGWVFFPPGFQEGARYPTLLRIHGGPNGMYGVSFNFEAQLLAANGYLVLITNPRGSSGYGREFGFALWQKWGIPDFEDVMAGVDYVVDQGWADGDRLGVGGWSYGGILTNYVITKSTRFKAAISGASMGLLVANYGHDHYQLGNEREWGLPWENRQLWEDLSAWNDIADVTTPTLFMGGESDWNVPILNSEQMYQALKRRDIDTRLVVYPGQPHGLRIPSYNVHRYKEYLSWYDKYLKGEEAAAGGR
ncbi:prolyl oligopeptidase family serine peptidase [Gemmatimonadota bacterium]